MAIAAVPTALAGIYGMNFEHMPELKWTWGYPLAVGWIVATCAVLFAAIVAAMLTWAALKGGRQ